MLEYLQAFDSCIRFVLDNTKCLNSCETWDLLLYNKPMQKTPYLSPLDFCCLCGWTQLGHILGHLAVHLDFGPLEGQRIARPSGLQPQWHHGSSLGSRWMGGRRGVGRGSFLFTRRWGKNSHFPMGTGRMKWTCVFFPWQRVSWVIELGRMGDAMGPAIVGSMRAFYKTLDIGPERWLLEDYLYFANTLVPVAMSISRAVKWNNPPQ